MCRTAMDSSLSGKTESRQANVIVGDIAAYGRFSKPKNNRRAVGTREKKDDVRENTRNVILLGVFVKWKKRVS